MSNTITCAVCKAEFPHNSCAIGKAGENSKPSTWYDVCLECHVSKKHEAWRKKTLEVIIASGLVTCGNLAADLEVVELYLKHDSRFQDGICPNGCSLLIKADAITLACPKCGFTYQNPSGVKIPT